MTNDLELATQMFRNTAAKYRRSERYYYKGEHDLSFATEKFESASRANVQGVVCNEPVPGDGSWTAA